ncbi:NmrA family NAD(P)-binding protein [Paraconexibacter antarcticus]|uniref:NmrA family NAD(P)-binding protein n=1 Tax=Paraconexibacter antarcticus TaxID=2949664 RepID=A0ABY5DM10_9ACTN|nr:NmrA family NAD(P)-binding protein [Paraconexibacter antarcticus]UTI62576.1 NmrA family NAD(P)-binding protein [Paraconexibacter antarcticus]
MPRCGRSSATRRATARRPSPPAASSSSGATCSTRRPSAPRSRAPAPPSGSRRPSAGSRAATAARLPHLVLASVAGARGRTGIPPFEAKAAVEDLLTASGLPHTITAPSYFFENVRSAVASGADVLPIPLSGDRPLQQIALADLGQVIATVLLEPARYAGERIELAGDTITPDAMAAVIAEVLGHPVRHVRTPLDEVRSPDVRAMYDHLERVGYDVDVAAVRARFPHVRWQTFGEWLRASR